MNPLTNRDLIYSIMLELPVQEINALILTNKLSASIDTNFFWKNKLEKDFNIQVKSKHYKKEYCDIVNSYKTAVNFVNIFKIVKYNCNIDQFYIPEDINIKNIYWLPTKIKNILSDVVYDDYYDTHDYNINYEYIGPILSYYNINDDYRMILDYNKPNNNLLYDISENLNKEEIIDSIAKFLYHYPNIKFRDWQNNELLYKDLKYKPDLSYIEKCILKLY